MIERELKTAGRKRRGGWLAAVADVALCYASSVKFTTLRGAVAVSILLGACGGSQHAARGALTAAQLSAVVDENRGPLRDCYVSFLRTVGGVHPDELTLQVGAVVAPAGTVASVSTQGGGVALLHTCVQAAVKGWRFPASSQGAEFVFPLVFRPVDST